VAVNLKAIGEFLEEVRQSKHISRQQIASDLGWSDKTLQRIAYGQVDMKVSQFLTLLAYLAADASEISGLTDDPIAVCNLVDERVISAGATGNIDDLKKLVRQLEAAYEQYHMPWMRSEVITCRLMIAELQGNAQDAKDDAMKLFRRYLGFDSLTAFDFRLVSRVVSYIPYQELRKIFPGRDMAQRNVGWSNLDDQADSVLDGFYISLLDSAVDSANPDNVREVCEMFKKRVVLWSNYYFRMYKRLALAISGYLDCDCVNATSTKDQLLVSVANFIPEGIFRHDRDGIEKLWHSVEQIAANAD
jgi:transcriptional regulator with XRE-family HTH domain